MSEGLIDYVATRTGWSKERVLRLHTAALPWPVQTSLARLQYDVVCFHRQPPPRLIALDAKLERMVEFNLTQLQQEFVQLEQALHGASLAKEGFPLDESAKRMRQHAEDLSSEVGEDPEHILAVHRLLLDYYRTMLEPS